MRALSGSKADSVTAADSEGRRTARRVRAGQHPAFDEQDARGERDAALVDAAHGTAVAQRRTQQTMQGSARAGVH